MTATVAAVRICRCNHAERVHERDDYSDGRGACIHDACGCTTFRPAPIVNVGTGQPITPEPPVPAAAPVGGQDQQPAPAPTQPSAVAAAPEAANDPTPYQCPECPDRFERPQGLGAHRRYKHPSAPKLSAAAKEERPSQDGRSAPAPSLTPDTGARLALSGTATPEEPAAVDGDAPVDTAGSPDDDVFEMVEVDPDQLLLGLTQAVEEMYAGGASAVSIVEHALAVRRYITDSGWTVMQRDES